MPDARILTRDQIRALQEGAAYFAVYEAVPSLIASAEHYAARVEALEAEVARLREHNTKMARAWKAIANACDAAGPRWWDHPDGMVVVVAELPGQDYCDVADACRALAYGEVTNAI